MIIAHDGGVRPDDRSVPRRKERHMPTSAVPVPTDLVSQLAEIEPPAVSHDNAAERGWQPPNNGPAPTAR
ncbi:hypothetical protein C1I99_05010 [Micromonospora deserti]|uniref:Uncharacterized protein n=1 Tax=Micromonospora deserti TaxID=2070366 RepID=A0A2W2D924_9ACTN|nr:hypothetical protein C1I99_05010 [Micromonospora deserti]